MTESWEVKLPAAIPLYIFRLIQRTRGCETTGLCSDFAAQTKHYFLSMLTVTIRDKQHRAMPQMIGG